MKLIQQKTNSDCGIAAIAIVTGYNYQDVLNAFEGDIMQGVSARETDEILNKLKIEYVRQIYPTLYIGNYLITVPSLNIKGD